MRILFVNEKCGYFGGVEQNIADTVAGLRSRGHLCSLAYGELTNLGADGFRSLFERVFRTRELAAGLAGGDPLIDSSQFSSVVASVQPEVIYIHKTPTVDFCLPETTAVPTLRMVHDHDLCCPRRHKYFLIGGRICHHRADWRCWFDGAFLERDPFSVAGFRWVGLGTKQKEMRLNQRIDRLLVGSSFMRGELLQNGFAPEKVRILPPVVQVPGHGPLPVPDEPNVLFVGQLVRGKGVDLLLDSLALVSCEFSATIVGTGNARDKLIARAGDLGLSGRVRFAGWVGREAIGKFYDEAKVLAVPARWPEPFGMIGLEAMHRGRPIVAFDVGGIPDWLESGRTGYLVPEQDCRAFANALERLLRDTPLASEMGQRGLESVQSRFSFNQYLDGLEGHMQEVRGA